MLAILAYKHKLLPMFIGIMFVYLHIRLSLLTYKHKFQAVDSDGTVTSNADIHFYIDNVR